MTTLRYDPERVRTLRQRAGEALAALAAIHSHDPVAADAVLAARRAAANLGERWLPVLDRLAASDAMQTWHRSAPASPAALVALARRIVDDEIDDIVALRAALDDMAGDERALAAFFRALGAGETAHLLVRLGTVGDASAAEAALALAATVRRGLATASRALDAGFARRLVGSFADDTDDHRRNPAVALSYLLHDVMYDTRFLVVLAGEVVARELAAGEGHELDAFLLWPWIGVGGPPSILYRELDADRPEDEFYLASDPMYAVLAALGADSVAARAVLTNPVVAPYLLRDRNLGLDGMRRLAAVGVAAAAGPDVVAGADPTLLRDAAIAASAFVNLVGARDEDVLWWQYANPEVSTATATILGRHLPAVHFALLHGDHLDTARGDLVPLVDAVHGTGRPPQGALFDVAALDVMSALAVDTDDGIVVTRTALDLYQADHAAAASRRLGATGEGAGDFLREAVADAARLEAHFIERAGHRAEERGRSRDVITSFWIDVATFSIGQVPSAVSLEVPMVSDALGAAASAAKRLLADHEATAARDATANAAAAASQLAYVWYRELHRAGVITPVLPAAALDGGELVTWEEFQQLPDRERAVVRSRMEETNGRHGVNLDGGALRDVIKVQQLPIYQQLE